MKKLIGYSRGLFSTKPTKKLVFDRLASLISCVIQESGSDVLKSGSIYLKHDYRVVFRNNVQDNFQYMIRADLGPLLNKILSETSIDFGAGTRVITTRLANSLIAYFEDRSSAFLFLDDNLEFTANFVSLALSATYSIASKNNDKVEIKRLMESKNETHYVMETFESYGEAKECSRGLIKNSPEMFTDAFQLNI